MLLFFDLRSNTYIKRQTYWTQLFIFLELYFHCSVKFLKVCHRNIQCLRVPSPQVMNIMLFELQSLFPVRMRSMRCNRIKSPPPPPISARSAKFDSGVPAFIVSRPGQVQGVVMVTSFRTGSHTYHLVR